MIIIRYRWKGIYDEGYNVGCYKDTVLVVISCYKDTVFILH